MDRGAIGPKKGSQERFQCTNLNDEPKRLKNNGAKTINTPIEVLRAVRKDNPDKIFTLNAKKNIIGVKDDRAQSGFIDCAGLLLTGQWVSLPGSLLVNGKPLHGEWLPPESLI